MKLTLLLMLTLILVVCASCSPEAIIVDPARLETSAVSTQLMPSESTEQAHTETPLAAATATQQLSTTTAPAVTSTQTSATAATVTTVQPDLLGLPEVDQARADLVGRLSVAPDDIEVQAVEIMTWSDTSMGCPDPNMGYLQVLTEGLFIQLGYAGQAYNYHSGGGQPPFLCEPSTFGQKPAPTLDPRLLTLPAPG